MTATMIDTVKHVASDSPEFRKFLGRVIRNRYDSWTAYADESTEWCVAFYREVEGESLGDPKTEVRIFTDFKVSFPAAKELGDGKPFSDGENVFVARPRRMSVSYSDVRVLAKFMREGARISIEVSRGSASSSSLGLSFYELRASAGLEGGGTVAIGSVTLARNGSRLMFGSVDI